MSGKVTCLGSTLSFSPSFSLGFGSRNTPANHFNGFWTDVYNKELPTISIHLLMIPDTSNLANTPSRTHLRQPERNIIASRRTRKNESLC
jgi:hypothetical protein